MRKPMIRAFATALAVLVLALLGVKLAVQHNKALLINRAEQALGRKISVEQLDINFWPIGVRLVNFALADDPDFATGDFLRAKELRVELRVLPLFIGQVRPKRITLESPIITLVRDASGRYNFFSRGRNGAKSRARSNSSETRPARAPDRSISWIPASVISNGMLRYRDLTGGEITVTQIELHSSEFDLGEPSEIQLAAAVNADKPNLMLKSRIGPIGSYREFRDVLLDGEINATDLDLGKINKALPRLRKSLPSALRFDGVYTIKELRFKGPLNNLSLKGTVTGTDASFRFD